MFWQYSAPVQDQYNRLTNADIYNRSRYVLRIVYKDIYEAPDSLLILIGNCNFETPATLASALLSKMNRQANLRISAAIVGNVLTLTALAKDDSNELNSITEYSAVSMEASLYVTVPGALLSNIPVSVAGVTITKTQGNPGKGYWKQVRDLEVRNMGYKGHVSTGDYPEVKANLVTEKDATYDYMTIETATSILALTISMLKLLQLWFHYSLRVLASLSASQFKKK